MLNNRTISFLIGMSALLLTAPVVRAQQDLGSMSLEQLLNVEVTSASRKSQTLGEVAAALFVISAEDIRRSGVSSIPEALRMVPGIHVGRVDDSRWAVTSRGFNDLYSNKLLVLMDGRPIYTPYFAGVFWDEHILSIDNIERIEVIRGPGATIWGSNAVNGVINIISRSARDTQGTFLQARAGNRDSYGLATRFGDVTEQGWFYRVDFNALKENVTDSPLDTGNLDFYNHQKASFRIDGTPFEGHELRLEGAYYNGDSTQISNFLDVTSSSAEIVARRDDINSSGGWLMMDWSQQAENGEGWQFKAIVDKASREFILLDLDQRSTSLEFQSRHLLGENHDFIWGVGGRHLDLPFSSSSANFEVLEQNRDYGLLEFYVQDEINLSDKLSLTLGSKFEDSEYVDLEIQPSARLSWQLTNDLSIWTSVSRAARSPSFGEIQLRSDPNTFLGEIPRAGLSPAPVNISAIGNSGFGSEWLTAYELGIRGNPIEEVEFDFALFKFDYDDIRGAELLGLFCQPGGQEFLQNPDCLSSATHVSTSVRLKNGTDASSTGAELALQWQVTDNWRLKGAFSWFDFDFQEVSRSGNPSGNDEPGWLAHIRSQWSVSENTDLDITLRAVDESEVNQIDGYVTADLRFGWKPAPAVTVELIGQNLFDSGHTEFGSLSVDALPSRINSRVMARITWAP